MPRLGRLLAVLTSCALGCAWAKPDPAVDLFGRQLMEALERDDSVSLASALDPGLTTSTAWAHIAELEDTLTLFHRDSTSLIGYNSVQSPDAYRAGLTYEIHGQGWAIVTVSVLRRQGALVANGMHFTRTANSQAALTAFTLAGRTWRHYLVLGLAITCLLLSLGSALLVARTPMPRRWGWTLAAVIGYGQFGINWATGETFLTPLRFQLFCASYMRMGVVAPWIVTFSLPLGAAWALWRRHQFLAARPEPPAPIATE